MLAPAAGVVGLGEMPPRIRKALRRYDENAINRGFFDGQHG